MIANLKPYERCKPRACRGVVKRSVRDFVYAITTAERLAKGIRGRCDALAAY